MSSEFVFCVYAVIYIVRYVRLLFLATACLFAVI
jgi:hypothetical protein